MGVASGHDDRGNIPLPPPPKNQFVRGEEPMEFIVKVLNEARHLLLDAAVYILFGLLVSGLFRTYLNPNSIARHLGNGRFSSVFKAAMIGVPIPL
jgi:hypothetical protein